MNKHRYGLSANHYRILRINPTLEGLVLLGTQLSVGEGVEVVARGAHRSPASISRARSSRRRRRARSRRVPTVTVGTFSSSEMRR